MEKTKTKNEMTKLPVRCSIEFSKLCRFWSEKRFPKKKGTSGAKLSSAHFMKEAAILELVRCGVSEEYLKSIS
jgi:hypothetical protein